MIAGSLCITVIDTWNGIVADLFYFFAEPLHVSGMRLTLILFWQFQKCYISKVNKIGGAVASNGLFQ